MIVEQQPGIGPTLSSLMLDKGIPQKKIVAVVSTILGISTTQAHRKLKGDSGWEAEQLLSVLEHLEFPPRSFFSLIADEISEIHDGIFNNEYPCRIYLTEKNIRSKYEAFEINGSWFAYHNNSIPSNIFDKAIKKTNVSWIELQSEIVAPKASKPKIALMDDDEVICTTLSQLLQNEFDIDTYQSLSEISESIKLNHYDVYILDWITPDGSSYKLINEIRASKIQNTPIVVLTGKGHEVDVEISKAIDNFDIIGPLVKPVRIEILRSQLNRLFQNHGH